MKNIRNKRNLFKKDNLIKVFVNVRTCDESLHRCVSIPIFVKSLPNLGDVLYLSDQQQDILINLMVKNIYVFRSYYYKYYFGEKYPFDIVKQKGYDIDNIDISSCYFVVERIFDYDGNIHLILDECMNE